MKNNQKFQKFKNHLSMSYVNYVIRIRKKCQNISFKKNIFPVNKKESTKQFMDPFTTPVNCPIRNYRYYCSSESNTRPDFYISANDSVVRKLVFSDSDDDDDNSTTYFSPSEEEEEEEEELTLEYYEVMETEEYMDTTPHDEMDCVNENYICDFLCLKFNYKVFTQL